MAYELINGIYHTTGLDTIEPDLVGIITDIKDKLSTITSQETLRDTINANTHFQAFFPHHLRTRLRFLALEFNLQIGETEAKLNLAYGIYQESLHLPSTKNSNEEDGNLEEWKELQHNFGLDYGFGRRTTALTRVNNSFHLSESEQGLLYGSFDGVGNKHVRFQSTDYQQKAIGHEEDLEPRGKHGDKNLWPRYKLKQLPVEVGLKSANINHCDENHTDYWGITARAADLGSGELTALIKHLGW